MLVRVGIERGTFKCSVLLLMLVVLVDDGGLAGTVMKSVSSIYLYPHRYLPPYLSPQSVMRPNVLVT